LATKLAMPSESMRSGAKVALAKRAPIDGMTPMGLAKISPSPRHASAQATAQSSSSV
jgi:hypothetical protein